MNIRFDLNCPYIWYTDKQTTEFIPLNKDYKQSKRFLAISPQSKLPSVPFQPKVWPHSNLIFDSNPRRFKIINQGPLITSFYRDRARKSTLSASVLCLRIVCTHPETISASVAHSNHLSSLVTINCPHCPHASGNRHQSIYFKPSIAKNIIIIS